MCKDYNNNNINIKVEELGLLNVNNYKINVKYNDILIHSTKAKDKQEAIDKFNTLITYYEK